MKKRSKTTDEETETEVRSKNIPAITDYVVGAVKDHQMKIFEITTLTLLRSQRFQFLMASAVVDTDLSYNKENKLQEHVYFFF